MEQQQALGHAIGSQRPQLLPIQQGWAVRKRCRELKQHRLARTRSCSCSRGRRALVTAGLDQLHTLGLEQRRRLQGQLQGIDPGKGLGIVGPALELEQGRIHLHLLELHPGRGAAAHVLQQGRTRSHRHQAIGQGLVAPLQQAQPPPLALKPGLQAIRQGLQRQQTVNLGLVAHLNRHQTTSHQSHCRHQGGADGGTPAQGWPPIRSRGGLAGLVTPGFLEQIHPAVSGIPGRHPIG